MTRKFLEDMGLDKETIDKILDENSQDIGKAKADYDQVKKDLDSAKDEITTLNQTIEERDGQLETLKNSTEDVEGLKTQIKNLQDENKKSKDDFQAQLQENRFNSALELGIVKSGAKSAKAIKALLDMEEIKLVDGKLVGFDEQIEQLKGEYAPLFEGDNSTTGLPQGGGSEDLSKLSDAEYYARVMKKD